MKLADMTLCIKEIYKKLRPRFWSLRPPASCVDEILGGVGWPFHKGRGRTLIGYHLLD